MKKAFFKFFALISSLILFSNKCFSDEIDIDYDVFSNYVQVDLDDKIIPRSEAISMMIIEATVFVIIIIAIIILMRSKRKKTE